MFRIVLLIFVSIYFLWSFISQIFTSYIPFKQAQHINIYEFLETAVNNTIIKLEAWNTNWTINVAYQWTVLKWLNYYMTWVTNNWTNSWSIATVTWVVIETPWKINSKHWQQLEIFIPIMEENWQLLYVEKHNKTKVNDWWIPLWKNIDLDHMYLNITDQLWNKHEFFNDLNDDTDENDKWNPPESSKLNWKYLMYRQILEKFEPDIFNWNSTPDDWITYNYVDDIFEEFNVDFWQQKIRDKKSIIYLWKDYEHDIENTDNCISNTENIKSLIENASNWDSFILCKWTFEISERINITKKDIIIKSITWSPDDVIIKNTWWQTNWKGRIFAVQNNCDWLDIEWITFDYPWDAWIKFNKDTKNVKIINNIIKWKAPINTSNNKNYDNIIIQWNYIEATWTSNPINIQWWNKPYIYKNQIKSNNKEIVFKKTYEIKLNNNDLINMDYNKIIKLNNGSSISESKGNYISKDTNNPCDDNFPDNFTNLNCKNDSQYVKPISKNTTILERSLLLNNLYIYKLNLESYVYSWDKTEQCNIIKDSTNADLDWDRRLRKLESVIPPWNTYTSLSKWIDTDTYNFGWLWRYNDIWACVAENSNTAIEKHKNRTKYFLR